MIDGNEIEPGVLASTRRDAMHARFLGGVQAVFVHRVGNESADLGAHAVRSVEKDAAVLGNGLFALEQVLKNGITHVGRLTPLTDLRQLRGIAEQYDVLCAERIGERVGK